MKIAIMQPYFFPYIGYFQLIHSVDIYANLDHVSFMKRSYMVRNKLKNDVTIGLQVNNGSQNKKCNEVTVNFENRWIDKTIKTLQTIYGREKNFDCVMDSIILNNFKESKISVSEFNFNIIKNICSFLDIERNFINTTEGITDRKKGDGLIDISKKYGSFNYINAIGGRKLYTKDYFLCNNIQLNFCEMRDDIEINNPYRSILDVLFLHDKEHVKKEIIKYNII